MREPLVNRNAIVGAVATLALVGAASDATAATSRCPSVTVKSPGAEATGTRIRATNVGCRTARRTVRSFLCRDGRAPYGWRIESQAGASFSLRNGRWRVRFIAAGGVSTC